MKNTGLWMIAAVSTAWLWACTGDTGPAGPAGPAGPEGPPGADGEDGVDADGSCDGDADCDDGLFCNGVESCDAGACVAGTPPDCSDDVSCTHDVCDEATGMCVSITDQTLCEAWEVCIPTSGCEGEMPLEMPECQVSGWTQGRAIGLVSTSVDIADATVPLTLDTRTPIADGKMASDCADLRFVAGDGTELPYWIESGCNTTATAVWVRVPSIPFGTSTIYMQYGNDGAEAVSDASATFILYDDFETGDLAGWTAGVDLFEDGHDDGHAEDASTTTSVSGDYSARLRGDSSCLSGPFNGVRAYIERELSLPEGDYCVEVQRRADVTGFEFSTSGTMVAEVIVDGTGFAADSTSCSGSGCTATGSWAAQDVTLPYMSIGTLRLAGRSTDCADGNVYFDDVRVRGCAPVGEVYARMYGEMDCP